MKRGNERAFVCEVVADTSFRLPEGRIVRLESFPGPLGPVDVQLRTRYEHRGFTSAVPYGLLLDVQATAANSDQAISVAISEAELIVPPLATAANAAYGDARLLIAYDVDPASNEHPLQYNVLPVSDGALFTGSREIAPETAIEVLQAFCRVEGAERLHRAMVHYNEALAHWRPGEELRAVEGLFIASEVLAPMALDRHLHSVGKTWQDIARDWGDAIRQPVCPSCRHSWLRRGDVESAAREVLVFAEAHDTYRRVKKISDGLEHGFADLPDMHREAKEARDEAAHRVRRSLLEMLRLEPELLTTLASPPFDKPLRRDPVGQAYRMILRGPHDGLAPEGRVHPEFTAAVGVKDFHLRPDGGAQMTLTPNLHVRFGDGVTGDTLTTIVSDRATELNLIDYTITHDGDAPGSEA